MIEVVVHDSLAQIHASFTRTTVVQACPQSRAYDFFTQLRGGVEMAGRIQVSGRAGLERVYSDRDNYAIYVDVDPLMDPLRNEPRFQALCRRLMLGTRSQTANTRPESPHRLSLD
jgi:hypothetical protein